MHIIIAPNAFKNSLTAQEAAQAILTGLEKSNLKCTYACFPIGDGGDGTTDLLIEKHQGKVILTTVQNPLGRKIEASFGFIENTKTAIIELASASGIRLLQKEELSPLSARTFGTGQQIKAALDAGAEKIIIAMGGSATIDGGAGILKALGARFLDREGGELLVIPEDLSLLETIDISSLDERVESCEFTILCDVENPLLGEQGAARVFGPQKGASPEMIEVINRSLQKLVDVTEETVGKDISSLKYGGAAGGAAAGLAAYLNAKLVSGIDFFLDYSDFNSALNKATLIITGEGSIDEQTLKGKGPYGVAKRAKDLNKSTVALVGSTSLEHSSSLAHYFDVILPISHEAMVLKDAIPLTSQNLTRTATALGNALAIHS